MNRTNLAESPLMRRSIARFVLVWGRQCASAYGIYLNKKPVHAQGVGMVDILI